jgi:hypothetical protein
MPLGLGPRASRWARRLPTQDPLQLALHHYDAPPQLELLRLKLVITFWASGKCLFVSVATVVAIDFIIGIINGNGPDSVLLERVSHLLE